MNRKNISYKLLDYNDNQKPIITKARWGKITIRYKNDTSKYRDVIIWNNGFLNWDWSLSDTHHSPGIQLLEVKFLVDEQHCQFIILSTGFENVLQVSEEVIKWLKWKRIDYVILNSMAAIELYNETTRNDVGLLLHSTC